MAEMKPRIIDGEPVCTKKCNYNISPIPDGCFMCDPGDPCIPGLRKQRDERPTREEWSEAISIINAISKILRGDGDEVSQEMGEHEVVLQAAQVWNALQENKVDKK
jgi:hypothetical protein